jgi:hypothetical protein
MANTTFDLGGFVFELSLSESMTNTKLIALLVVNGFVSLTLMVNVNSTSLNASRNLLKKT